MPDSDSDPCAGHKVLLGHGSVTAKVLCCMPLCHHAMPQQSCRRQAGNRDIESLVRAAPAAGCELQVSTVPCSFKLRIPSSRPRPPRPTSLVCSRRLCALRPPPAPTPQQKSNKRQQADLCQLCERRNVAQLSMYLGRARTLQAELDRPLRRSSAEAKNCIRVECH